jgi:hypothetical protein
VSNIAFAEYNVDRRKLTGYRPANAVVVLQKGIQEALLDLYFFLVIEREIMASGNEAEIL